MTSMAEGFPLIFTVTLRMSPPSSPRLRARFGYCGYGLFAPESGLGGIVCMTGVLGPPALRFVGVNKNGPLGDLSFSG